MELFLLDCAWNLIGKGKIGGGMVSGSIPDAFPSIETRHAYLKVKDALTFTSILFSKTFDLSHLLETNRPPKVIAMTVESFQFVVRNELFIIFTDRISIVRVPARPLALPLDLHLSCVMNSFRKDSKC